MSKHTFVVSRSFVRTKGKIGTPERETYTQKVDVEIEVDIGYIAQTLGFKALLNKSGRSRALGGAVIVRAEERAAAMIVWRITGNEIGPNGNGAAHFATKREADKARREYMSDSGGSGNVIDPPERIVITSRAKLARALDDAMGYGGS